MTIALSPRNRTKRVLINLHLLPNHLRPIMRSRTSRYQGTRERSRNGRRIFRTSIIVRVSKLTVINVMIRYVITRVSVNVNNVHPFLVKRLQRSLILLLLSTMINRDHSTLTMNSNSMLTKTSHRRRRSTTLLITMTRTIKSVVVFYMITLINVTSIIRRRRMSVRIITIENTFNLLLRINRHINIGSTTLVPRRQNNYPNQRNRNRTRRNHDRGNGRFFTMFRVPISPSRDDVVETIDVVDKVLVPTGRTTALPLSANESPVDLPI